MPIYSITAPNGRTYEIEGPPGATQDEVIAEILRRDPSAGQAPSTERTMGEAVKDVGAGVVRGVGSLVQLPGQAYGLVTGDWSDTGALGLGRRIEAAGEEMKSEGLKAREAERQRKVQEAEEEGQLAAFKTSFMETVKDPALLSSFVAEQLPQLLPIIATGGAAAAATAGRASAAALAKGATKEAAAQAARAAAVKAGTTAAIHTGAAMQGTDVGASTYDAIYQRVLDQDGTPEQAAEAALNRARAAGVAGYGLSVLANRYMPGGQALEKALVGQGTGIGMLKAGAIGMAKEVPSEMTEEVGGALARNVAVRGVDPTQSLTQGLGETAAQAAIGAAALGGAAGTYSGRGLAPKAERKPQEEPQPAPPEPQVEDETDDDLPVSADAVQALEELAARREAAGDVMEARELRKIAERRRQELQKVELRAHDEQVKQVMAGIEVMPYEDLAKTRASLKSAPQTSTTKAAVEAITERMRALDLPRVKAAQRGNELAKDSAFGQEMPDLFGMYYPPLEQDGQQEQQAEAQPDYDPRQREMFPYQQDMFGAAPQEPVEQAESPAAEPERNIRAATLQAPLPFNRPTRRAKDGQRTRAARAGDAPDARAVEPSVAAPVEPAGDARAADAQQPGAPDRAGVGDLQPVSRDAAGDARGDAPALTEPPAEPEPELDIERVPTPVVRLQQALEAGQVPQNQTRRALDTMMDELIEIQQNPQHPEHAQAGNYIARNIKDEAFERALRQAEARAHQRRASQPEPVAQESAPPTREEAADADLYGTPVGGQGELFTLPEGYERAQSLADRVREVRDLEAQRAEAWSQVPDVKRTKEAQLPLTQEAPRKGGPRFSTAQPKPAPRNPISHTELERAVQRVTRALGLPEDGITILDDVRQFAPSEDPGSRSGVMKDDQIVLFRSGIESGVEGEKTILHELFHRGLHRLLPQNEYLQAMDRLYRQFPQVREAAATWLTDPQNAADVAKYGPAMQWAIATEESMAIMAESRMPPSALRRLGNWIANLASRLGLKRLAAAIRQMGTTELEALIDSVLRQDGAPAKVKGAEAVRYASKKPPSLVETSAFRRWFGDSKVVDANGEPLVVYHGSRDDISEFAFEFFDFDSVEFGDQDGPFTTVYGVDKEGMKTPVGRYLVGKSGSAIYLDASGATEIIEVPDGESVEDAVAGFVNPPRPISDRVASGVRAFFFAEDPAYTGFYSIWGSTGEKAQRTKYGATYPVYLSIQNPLLPTSEHWAVIEPFFVDQFGGDEAALFKSNFLAGRWESKEAPGFIEFAKSKGFDGYVNIEGGASTFNTGLGFGERAPGGIRTWAAFDPAQIKSATGNRGTFDPTNPDIRYRTAKPPAEKTAAGRRADAILTKLDMQPPPRVTAVEKAVQASVSAVENPAMTAQSMKEATSRWVDRFGNAVFSSNFAFNARVRQAVQGSINSDPAAMGMLLSVTDAQVDGSAVLGGLFIKEGNLRYDPELYKLVAEKDTSLLDVATTISQMGSKHGLTAEQASQVMDSYFEARRTQRLLERNAELEQDAQVYEMAGMKKKARETREKIVIGLRSPEWVQQAMELGTLFPELTKAAEQWNTVRKNAAKLMVDSGLWTAEQAEDMLSAAEYVPFYREGQTEAGKGPKEFMTGLQVRARERRLRGSERQVNDIFDNMVRWTQFAVERSVRNRMAQTRIDVALQLGMAEELPYDAKGGTERNVVTVWRDGIERKYQLDDPLLVDAFAGLESLALPSLQWWAKLTNLFRQSVVLNPLFGILQVPQDAIAAIYTSGLKPRYAFTVPARAVKEFLATLLTPEGSAAHRELRKVGAVGVKDVTAEVVRMDLEVLEGAQRELGMARPLVRKISKALHHVAMASDSAVRQAVYTASLDQGLSRAEAMEKAFQIINFRNRGTSKGLAMAARVVPFLNAYIAAQHVAYKTITGNGTSPTDRAAARQTLAATTAGMLVLSTLYAMALGGDEGYEKRPLYVRDRVLVIPGTGGLSIPMRSDIFAFPKVLAEHMWHHITEDGTLDGANTRRSMTDLLANSVIGPYAPQAIKPAVEVAFNYDFFRQRPIVGASLSGAVGEHQFTDSTSELSKAIGAGTGLPPAKLDHLIRGYLGSLGGLIMFMSNDAIALAMENPRPEMPLWDAIASFPGASTLLPKQNDSAARQDFYELKEAVDRVTQTLTLLNGRSPEQLDKYLSDPVVEARYGLSSEVRAIYEDLSEIRKAVTLIRNDPGLSAAQKRADIEELRQAELELLSSLPLKEMRREAKL